MYALERLVYQGENVCPKYKWKQLAICGNRELLVAVKNQMLWPEDWRITPMAFTGDFLNVLSKQKAA